uniref:JAB1/MPN/MOV34 metalloenzyme domain-containing protein n=1 Tax=Oryza meridionalis TaxID=40149 RepID=A0A0E0FE55_9ORYZ
MTVGRRMQRKLKLNPKFPIHRRRPRSGAAAAAAAAPAAASGIPHRSPHEDDLGAGAGDVLTFRFHSLAVLKLSDRIREYRLHDYQYQATRGWYSSGTAPEDALLPCAVARPPRMYGCVIGVQRGRTVEVVDTFDILLDTDPGTLDRDLLKKKLETYKKAFPGLAILGWYSIDTHVTNTDMETNQALMDASGTAFYLLFNPAMNLSQKDLPVTIYEKEAERISLDHACPVAPDVSAPPLGKGQHANIMHTCGFKLMLFEIPSGFAMFEVSQELIARPKDIWAWFAYQDDITNVIVTLGSIQIDNKSVARDISVGPGDELREFILRFCTHNYLIVQDVELKDVIEKKLNIYCYCNPTVVDELTWGLCYVLHELLPQEQSLTHGCCLPLSKALAKQIKEYGFKISPRGEMVPRDERYSRAEIMEFIDYIISAPGNRSRTLSLLGRIEAASIDDSPPPPSPPAEMGASGRKRLRLDWIALCCLGCTVALQAFYRKV